jgi:hypothetical protein
MKNRIVVSLLLVVLVLAGASFAKTAKCCGSAAACCADKQACCVK